MATKTFLKSIVIEDRKAADKFVNALEDAENKKVKKVKTDKTVKEISDHETIRKIFDK